jgi:hypothetical protein
MRILIKIDNFVLATPPSLISVIKTRKKQQVITTYDNRKHDIFHSFNYD